MNVVADVVSYDPVRCEGLLKAVGLQPELIRFGLRVLPEEIRSALDAPTRRLRVAMKQARAVREGRSVSASEDLPAAINAAKAVIAHQRFVMDVSRRPDGKWTITWRTMQWLPEPIWQVGAHVRICQLKSPPEAYDGWGRNQRAPGVGEVGAVHDFLHAPGIPDHYVVECAEPLENGRPLWLGEFRADELDSVD